MSRPLAERKTRSESARTARREEILAAARTVFSRQGFRGTTIADIAEEAGIALGTIYLYFASKEDVFAALSEQFNQLIAHALTDVPTSASLDQAVRVRVGQVFEACAANRDLVRLVVLNTDPDSAATRRMRDANEKRALPMAEVITNAMGNGVVRKGDATIMTKLTVGAVSMTVYQAFVLNDGRDWEKYRDACGDMLVAYFTPLAGEAEETDTGSAPAERARSESAV
ncbi:MAG: TetR/AcrR family transcriptional regulator [Chloroflexi bacterium]|nr:TetR/AcrR family transcriptional regulator [Chloroflexota bacterium]